MKIKNLLEYGRDTIKPVIDELNLGEYLRLYGVELGGGI